MDYYIAVTQAEMDALHHGLKRWRIAAQEKGIPLFHCHCCSIAYDEAVKRKYKGNYCNLCPLGLDHGHSNCIPAYTRWDKNPCRYRAEGVADAIESTIAKCKVEL